MGIWRISSIFKTAARRASAARSNARGSDDATAMATAGFVLVMLGRDYEAGLAAVRHALDLNRNNAFVSILAGWANNFAGDLDDALASFQRAQRLSPSDPGAFFF